MELKGLKLINNKTGERGMISNTETRNKELFVEINGKKFSFKFIIINKIWSFEDEDIQFIMEEQLNQELLEENRIKKEQLEARKLVKTKELVEKKMKKPSTQLTLNRERLDDSELTVDKLVKGKTYYSDELTQIFDNYSLQRAIRYKINSDLVQVITHMDSKEKNNPYMDYYNSDTGEIRYTGEGRIGDQALERGNYIIANAEKLHKRLFYFIVYSKSLYTFIGEVYNYKKYDIVEEKDTEGHARSVYKFNLRVKE